MSKEFKYIGKSVPRVDAAGKVTGQTRFITDQYLDRMIYAYPFYSASPFWKVTAIDIAIISLEVDIVDPSTGKDSISNIECLLHKNSEEYNLSYIFKRLIKPGTSLTFKPNFRLTEHSIQSPYLDNRMGIWMLLKLAETLDNGVIAFTCWEEHGGGSVEFITKYLYEKFKIHQIIIADTTYTSEGINHGDGVVISLRDENIPRKIFVDKIQNIALVNNLKYQVEVEYSGGSDGGSVQKSPYPVDWCFVGPPISNIHSPDEIINKNDIFASVKLYQSIMDNL